MILCLFFIRYSGNILKFAKKIRNYSEIRKYSEMNIPIHQMKTFAQLVLRHGTLLKIFSNIGKPTFSYISSIISKGATSTYQLPLHTTNSLRVHSLP